MTVHEIIALAGEIIGLLGIIVGVVVAISKVIDGQKCLMRSEMLRIYYKYKETKEIRQYEYENFVLLYEAYKKLKGNSFIDKVYAEIQKWTIVT
jgi:hypothetical protein